jgi:hypothetical protein
MLPRTGGIAPLPELAISESGPPDGSQSCGSARDADATREY